MASNKISKNEILSQIELLLKDEFIAKVIGNGEEISLEFLNGQKFKLALTEAK